MPKVLFTPKPIQVVDLIGSRNNLLVEMTGFDSKVVNGAFWNHPYVLVEVKSEQTGKTLQTVSLTIDTAIQMHDQLGALIGKLEDQLEGRK